MTTETLPLHPDLPSPRRPRRFRPKGWRLSVARFLRRIADWLCPLEKARP